MASAVPIQQDTREHVPSNGHTNIQTVEDFSTQERGFCEEICANLSDGSINMWSGCAICAGRIAGKYFSINIIIILHY